MDLERLIVMANDVGNFFNSEPDRTLAVEGIADHLRKFWDPRMRAALLAHHQAGGLGLSEPVRQALNRLR